MPSAGTAGELQGWKTFPSWKWSSWSPPVVPSQPPRGTNTELLRFLLPSATNPLKKQEQKVLIPAKIPYLCCSNPQAGFSRGNYSLWDVERLEKAALVRPASHSRLSCRLAKALRSLTSRRISCWGISLSPKFPIRTSDSLPKAALKGKAKPPSGMWNWGQQEEASVTPQEGQNSPRGTIPGMFSEGIPEKNPSVPVFSHPSPCIYNPGIPPHSSQFQTPSQSTPTPPHPTGNPHLAGASRVSLGFQ